MAERKSKQNTLVSKLLAAEFPNVAIDALEQYYENHIIHLSESDGEILPRSEYMDLLQRSAPISYAFLGCSRTSAYELLNGKYTIKEIANPGHRIRQYTIFICRNILPIIAMWITILQINKLPILSNIINIISVTCPWSKTPILWLLFVGMLCWICFECLDYKNTQRTKQSFQENTKHVYDRFDAYNEILSKRLCKDYPTVRIFVLDGVQIQKDNKLISRKIGKTWWEAMVEGHDKYNIGIARICLTDKLRKNFDFLSNQFSLFTVPGQGGWVIVTKEHLDTAVKVACLGRRAFHRYRTLFGELRRLAHSFTMGNNMEIEELTDRIHDFSLCASCTESGHHLCDRKKCPNSQDGTAKS